MKTSLPAHTLPDSVVLSVKKWFTGPIKQIDTTGGELEGVGQV
jgi:hypothetical protein